MFGSVVVEWFIHLNLNLRVEGSNTSLSPTPLARLKSTFVALYPGVNGYMTIARVRMIAGSSGSTTLKLMRLPWENKIILSL